MSTENKSAAELAAETKAAFEKSMDAVRAVAEEALGKASSGETLTASLKEKADEALIAATTAKERLDDLEQKMARGTLNGDGEQKTIGQQFVDSEGVKAFLAGRPSSGSTDMRLKATLTTVTTDTAGAVGDAVNQTRLPGVMPLAQRRMTIRDLISPGRMDGNTLEYVKETGFTNNAAMVAEGALKPESDIKLDLITTTAKVIAHNMKASRQALEDIPQLSSLIDNRLIYGVKLREEAQILNGDGTGQNLLGIVPQATAYAAAFAPSAPSAIDTIRLAALQAFLAEYPASGVVMHPTDWARIELTKDADGRYIIGNPQGAIAPTLWGLSVVPTQAIAIDKVLVGAFQMGAQIFDRWDARVEMGYVNDDFTKNLVTLLGEERLALAVYRPEAFVYADLGFVA